MAYQTKKNRHIWLSIVSGILLWFAWPDNIFGFLLHLALIPLLIIESELTSRYYKKPALRYFLSLLLTFMVWHTLSILSGNTVNITVSDIFLNSCLMTAPMMLFFFTKRASGQIAGYFSYIIYWIAFEYLMLHWNISGPWPILGNGFASLPYLVQWYEVTGQQGGSLWVLCSNLILFHTIKTGYINNVGIALFSFLFILPAGSSILRYLTYNISGQPAKVAITYPGIKNDAIGNSQKKSGHDTFGLKDQQDQINVIIQAPHLLSDKTAGASSTSEECRHFDIKSITNASFYPDYLLFSRTRADKSDAGSLFLSSDKHYGLKKSENFRHISVCTRNSNRIGIMSGNELISGESVTAHIRKGIRFIFLITEAAPRLSRTAPGQYARLRSIETRRDILLSSEEAVTGYINQKGDYIRISALSPEKNRVIRDNIRLNTGATFYARYGDYIGISSFYFALICIFILFGGLLVKRTNFI